MNTTTQTVDVATTIFRVPRKHLRFPFSGKADLTAMPRGQHLAGQVSEIGPRGCYVDTPDAFRVGTKVHMFIRNAAQGCVLSGTVLYVHKGWGTGVLFDDGQPEAFETLDNWLTELAGKALHPVVH